MSSPGSESTTRSVSAFALGFGCWRKCFLSASLMAAASLVTSIVSIGAQPNTSSPANDPIADVDHLGIIGSWNAETLNRGEKLYQSLCLPCHGTPEKQGSLPSSRAFWREPFKNGNDPFSIYKTIGSGLGQMPAWPWLSAQMRYDIIDYIRERFVRPNNPANYFLVTPAYLGSLPKGTGKIAIKSAQLIEFEKGPKYLRMDFGPVLNWTFEVASNNFAYKGIAIRIDPGNGGISKGHAWMVYDQDTMRVAAAWSGDQFVDWKGIAFDGSHQTHTSIVGDKAFVNPIGPGWADPGNASFADPRLKGRDGKQYGPLPRSWTHYLGTHRCGDQVVLSYSVGDARVLESPGCEGSGTNLGFVRTLNIGRSSRDLVLRVAQQTARRCWSGRTWFSLRRRMALHSCTFRVRTPPST